jgi:hypothetical protein
VLSNRAALVDQLYGAEGPAIQIVPTDLRAR